MIITLTKADFSSKNIGMLNAFAILTNLGRGCVYSGPATVNKNDGLQATIKIEGNNILHSMSLLMGGNECNEYVIHGDTITLDIAKVIGAVVIKVVTLNLDNTAGVWAPVACSYEQGTTNDDGAGTMGNKVNNASRVRSAEPISGNEEIKIIGPDNMSFWINYFDENGNLVDTTRNTLHFANYPNGYTSNLKALGATYMWPIFRWKDGVTPTTITPADVAERITIEGRSTNYHVIPVQFEQGTFADGDDTKTNSNARVRTIERIRVPAAATGIYFKSNGGSDLWIKGYADADINTCSFEGVRGAYWNKNNKDILTLQWGNMGASTSPAYVDFVIKNESAEAITPSHDSILNTEIGFTY